MLPIYLDESTLGADLALILQPKMSQPCGRCERSAVEKYAAPTALTLEMAYNNARVVTRPHSEWLSKAANTVQTDATAAEEHAA